MYYLVHTYTKLELALSTINMCEKYWFKKNINAWLENSRFLMNIHFIKINLQESLKKSNKCASAKVENTMYIWLSYNWHQNMYLSQNSHALS